MWGLELSPLEIAICCRAAENEHYAKPCGLMDQLSCAGEGTVYIDFKDMSAPVIKPLSLKPEEHGFSLILSDCGRDHADLTGDFESITKELSAVSACFGKSFLREVPEKMFMNELSALRRICGDRAVLRAMHVYGENARVERQLAALEADDFDAFLALVRESGLSSWRLLQNVVPSKDPARQEMAVGLALSEKILAGRGACRVQGGGFAGWLQAYVPFGLEETYVSAMESCLGTGCCRRVSLL
jgi:galactokinase